MRYLSFLLFTALLVRAERSYDCGVKYYPLVQDIDHDGLDEVLVYDRDRVWIFHAPE